MNSRRPLPTLVAAAFVILGFSAFAADPTADPSLSALRDCIARYGTDLAAIERRYAVPGSETHRERLGQFFAEQQRGLEAVNFDALDQDGRIDYLLLRNRIRFERQQLEHRHSQDLAITNLVPFAPVIARLEEARNRMEPLDAAAAADQISAVTRQLADTRKALEARLKEPRPTNAPAVTDKVVANRALRRVRQLRETFHEWRDFYAGYDPGFTWWLREPGDKLDKDLQDYAKFLREKLVGATEGEDDPVLGDPIGRAALLDALANEFIVYTPEELIEIANREFAWCETEWKRAAHDMGLGDDWRKALDRASRDYVKPGEQPQLIRDLGREAEKFAADHNLVSVPPLCSEIWRMEMMSPERQKVNPYFTGGEIISVSYPTDGMSGEDKLMSLRGNNVHFCRATVLHELIPGHHLQIYMSERWRTHRRAFSTPFLVEGWALHWEMRFWDLGFPKTPEDRVGMLFWRTHRCARIIFSLKFHLGQMTAAEAIDFLVDRVGHERRNATAEVRRSVAGGYGPLYQAAYLLGGLQMRSLQREVVDAKQMTERDFHDAVLRENAIPIELIRASLEHRPLTRDYSAGWRFYDAK